MTTNSASDRIACERTVEVGPAECKVLVFRIGSLGDTLVALPCLKVVRDHFAAHCEITLLRDLSAQKDVIPEDLLQGHSCVDGFMDYPVGRRGFGSIIAMLRLARELRRGRFDVLVYLAPSQRSRRARVRDRAFFRACGIGRLLGFEFADQDVLYPRTDDGRPGEVKREAEFLLDRLAADGIVKTPMNEIRVELELTSEETRRAAEWLRSKRQHPRRAVVAVAPGVNQSANQWPFDRFIHLGRALVEDRSCELLIVGGDKDRALGKRLTAEWGSGINAAGCFGPRMSAALLAHCRLFIGLDSGPMHLAAAVGLPCISLFSDRDNPGRWHPLGEGHRVIRKKVSCGGCRLNVCDQPEHPCMSRITLEEVLNAVRSRLDELAV